MTRPLRSACGEGRFATELCAFALSCFIRGEFAQDAPGARSVSPAFVYTQITGTI